jgi:hypothetical protein
VFSIASLNRVFVRAFFRRFPKSLAEQIGVAHAAENYALTSKSFLIEGAEAIRAMASSMIMSERYELPPVGKDFLFGVETHFCRLWWEGGAFGIPGKKPDEGYQFMLDLVDDLGVNLIRDGN